MSEILDLILKISRSHATVLVTGETGTGKDLVAQTIHRTSTRNAHSFVAVNCNALPAPLLESELFGHVRGAFTGACTHRKGLFAMAQGGTIFLDEIGDLEPALQAKLLRVLQEREVRPVGGLHTTHVDARVIAATNQDLRTLVREGRFREDLFHRLNVIAIHVPPLRRRRDAIPALAEKLLHELTDERPIGISPDALEHLQGLPWPGNVRELRNVLERALVLKTGSIIQARDIWTLAIPSSPGPALTAKPRRRAAPYLTLAEMKQRYVREVLRDCQGNKTLAARVLGVNRKLVAAFAARAG